MKLLVDKCVVVNQLEVDKVISWVKKNVWVLLIELQIVGIVLFCFYNIGLSKCFIFMFYKKFNVGDCKGVCVEIKCWVYDGGRDCNICLNNCYGQIECCVQESELICWGLDE